MTEVENNEMAGMLDRHLCAIGEHVEAVQIMVTYSDVNGTHSLYRGCGNFYARLGMAHSFIERDKADDHASKISQALRDRRGE